MTVSLVDYFLHWGVAIVAAAVMLACFYGPRRGE